MRKACVYFHQGWTDIIMCLALINYYKSQYDEIYVLIRSDAKDIVEHYVKNLVGVHIVYLDTDNGRFYGGFQTTHDDRVIFRDNSVFIPENFDLLFHGEHDRFRKDGYKNYWWQPDYLKMPTNHFSEMFYVFYGIDFSTRINYFTVDRDTELEERKYLEFIEQHGKDYVIYHDDENNHQYGSLHVSTKIDFENKLPDCAYVNVNKQSSILLDYIKIFKEAKEIHLIDSLWACMFYQLDARYGILQDKTINLYCKRGHQNLFQFPVKLNNWILK
jgi:hypothetical protein